MRREEEEEVEGRFRNEGDNKECGKYHQSWRPLKATYLPHRGHAMTLEEYRRKYTQHPSTLLDHDLPAR